MEGEAGVLQQRVQIVAVDRRLEQADERVRGEQDEGEEGGGDRRLDRKDAGAQGGGRLPPQTATMAPKSVRISIQSSIEPSWLPQVPASL